MNAISDWELIKNGFDFSYLLDLLSGIIPSLICITLHELSHGLVAYRLGDDTAKRAGRLTLNPLKHLDPIGLLMMLTVHFGYAKPVPVNMYRFKDPKRGMAITAFAGPLSNVLIAVLFLFLYGFLYPILPEGKAGDVALEMLGITASLSLAMAIFNLLPIPPLDGSKVLFSLLPEEGYWRLMQYERYGFLVLIALLYFNIIDGPLQWLLRTGMELLAPVLRAGFSLGTMLV